MGDKSASGLAQTMLPRPSSECTGFLVVPKIISMFLHEKEPGYEATHDIKDVSSHDLCRKLSAHDNWSQLAVHVALDMVVVIEDLSKTPHSVRSFLSGSFCVPVVRWVHFAVM